MGRPCDACGDASDYANGHGAWCEAHTARARHEDAEAARWDAMYALEGCENSAGWDGMGRARKYCSNTHSQKAYKTREEYRAEQRQRAPAGNALADYDPAYAAKTMGRGIPQDWPLCTCDADVCPDKGAA